MKKYFTILLTSLGSIMLIVALLIVSIEMFALNPSFFRDEYDKLDTAVKLHMSEEDLAATTQVLLDYTSGKRDNLEVQAVINGVQREVFTDKTEVEHMVDVQALYINARTVRTVFFICFGVFFILSVIISGKEALKTLCRSFLRVSVGFLIVVGVLAAYAAIDFNGFWVSFHHVFFSGNDLWQLDPSKSMLINLVPEEFFSDLVARIIIRFVSIFITLNIAAAAGNMIIKRLERRRLREVGA